MVQIKRNDEWLDSCNRHELTKLAVVFSDGEDIANYSFDDMVKLLEDSYHQGYTERLNPSEIIDKFYTDLELNGNNTVAIFYNGTSLEEIQWTR